MVLNLNSFSNCFPEISHGVLDCYNALLEEPFLFRIAQISTPALPIDCLMSGIGLRAHLASTLLLYKQNFLQIFISVLPSLVIHRIFYTDNPQPTPLTNAVQTQRPYVQLLQRLQLLQRPYVQLLQRLQLLQRPYVQLLQRPYVQLLLNAVTILVTTWLANQCMLKFTSFLLKQYTAKWVALSCAFTIYTIHELVLNHLPFTVNTKEQVKRQTRLQMVLVRGMIALALSTEFLRNINPFYKNAVVIPLTHLFENVLAEHAKKRHVGRFKNQAQQPDISI